MTKLHEECGVFGIAAKTTTDVASPVYYGLHALQHRGQESCGIVVNDDGLFSTHCDLGLVSEVFTQSKLEKLGHGALAVGHCRYGTAKSNDRANCQPIVVNHSKGRLALAHNGSLTNAAQLREEIEATGSIFHTNSDSEVISYVITKERLTAPTIEEAVSRAMSRLEGAYSLVIMSPTKLIAVRDPHGFRPLCYGINEDGDYIVASETCALDAVGAKLIRDIEPGEVLVFKNGEVISDKRHCNTKKRSSCIFEYIYFARPDSVIDECSVHQARKRAGAFLAQEYPVEADVVIGVPDSGLDGALGYAQESGIPYGIGLIKNKYVGRTFIAPTQKMREKAVKMKLNPVSETVKGKRVVLIDDSIVRGTTCANLVRLIRDAGAKEVHMRVLSPKFINCCYYGTDISDPSVLIANNYTTEEIEKRIGVDSLGFLSIESVVKIPNGMPSEDYCIACFNSKYPTAIPEKPKASKFDQKISERKKGE
ncbi:MAG: amidophosphoribosyltransferase [Clostridia bacterium]|jgi:amidophosphoribosyltransferase|nr:amidophosphoribosyltransferase [Clostridia bacterium]MBQ1942214.1 amidophosphoribosyltransferase [Clostridia bacterium]